ncbi:protein-tyrosine-phosphatase MKP1 [Lathyrus oleraceus]|nr:protein-tyrosine-phosphatase MKP1-like [Pisum sativum]
MYRIAPHSPYDPLHLILKMLTYMYLSALDSRSAFTMHIPSEICVWIDKSCETIKERDTRGVAGQIVRYGRVKRSIIMIIQGGEPPYFWDVFSILFPLMDISRSGVKSSKTSVKIFLCERKVDAYDVDFEVFGIAIMGGCMPPFGSSANEHETHIPTRESNRSVLRRKYSSTNVKEFVSALKLSFRQVYSDSMLCIHASAISFPSPSASLRKLYGQCLDLSPLFSKSVLMMAIITPPSYAIQFNLWYVIVSNPFRILNFILRVKPFLGVFKFVPHILFDNSTISYQEIILIATS